MRRWKSVCDGDSRVSGLISVVDQCLSYQGSGDDGGRGLVTLPGLISSGSFGSDPHVTFRRTTLTTTMDPIFNVDSLQPLCLSYRCYQKRDKMERRLHGAAYPSHDAKHPDDMCVDASLCWGGGLLGGLHRLTRSSSHATVLWLQPRLSIFPLLLLRACTDWACPGIL